MTLSGRVILFPSVNIHRLKVSLSLGGFLDDMYPKAQILFALVIARFFTGFSVRLHPVVKVIQTAAAAARLFNFFIAPTLSIIICPASQPVK